MMALHYSVCSEHEPCALPGGNHRQQGHSTFAGQEIPLLHSGACREARKVTQSLTLIKQTDKQECLHTNH